MNTFLFINTPGRSFVSLKSASGHCSAPTGYVFDGVRGEATEHKDWLSVPAMPEVISRIIAASHPIVSYRLLPEFVGTPNLADTVEPAFFAYDSNTEEYNNGRVMNLYEAVREEVPERYEPVSDERVILADKDYSWQPRVLEYPVVHSLLDCILTHPILRPELPCKLSRQDSYNIIRQHVKANLNGRFAQVTSDYDFCFEVSKIVKLAESHNQTYDENMFSARRRKPKMVTRIVTNSKHVVFRMSPKVDNPDKPGNGWRSYPLVEPFEGQNYDDIVRNIEEYLAELMDYFNSPQKQCEHCKGLGIVREDFPKAK